MKLAVLMIVLGAATPAAADPPAPTAATQADVAILTVTESDRGGAPDDGDLWREQISVAVDGEPGATLTRQFVANSPIPDSIENRSKFGQPLSASGRATAAKPGRVSPSDKSPS